MSDVVIVGAKRTAIGSFLGQFTGVPSPTLGAAAIQAALAQSGVAADQIDEVIIGCVLPAGLGQAPARQASRAAGIPDAAGCTTINKVCGSGMKAVMLAHDLITGQTWAWGHHNYIRLDPNFTCAHAVVLERMP